MEILVDKALLGMVTEVPTRVHGRMEMHMAMVFLHFKTFQDMRETGTRASIMVKALT